MRHQIATMAVPHMSQPSADQLRGNRLLASLPTEETERLSQCLRIRDFDRGTTIQEPWEKTTEIVFPLGAIVSVVVETESGQGVEVTTIGREGLSGSAAFLDNSVTPLRSLIQVPGEAAVGKVADLVTDDPSPLRSTVLRYMQSTFVHAAVTASCNRLHPLEQRAARWLLTTSDRLGSETLHLTHEFFAVMLGAQRPSVSLAVQVLRRAGLITYQRGVIQILDREGLAEAACECYETISTHYEQTMGIPRR